MRSPSSALLDRLVGEAQFLRPDFAEENAAHRGLDDFLVGIAKLGLLAVVGIRQANPLVGCDRAVVEGEHDFGLRAEQLQLLRVGRRRRPRLGGQIEAAQRNVLRRRDNRPAAGRAEDVVGRHHEQARFQLRFDGKRHVNGHLVAVEVGVVRGADQRMDANGFAFDELRLEGLHRQAVQGRGAVEQHGMAAGHFFENVPHLGGLALDQLLGRAHGMDVAQFFEAADDERLEQDERHLLGQTALVQLEFGADDDDRTAGVIHALAQQVLAEAPALALEHVAERFQGAIAGPGHRAAMAAVVEQRIDGFLQHALFVADDDFRGLELEQVLQPVVAVDDAAIEIVEIGGGKAAAFQRHQRAQVRRDDRQHREDHPFRTALGGLQTLEQLDALGDLLADLLALGFGHGRLQVVDLLAEVHFRQRIAHGFGAHLGEERVGAVGFPGFAIFVLAQKLVLLERRRAGVDDHVVFVVNHPLEIAGGHVEHQADAGGHAFEEPDMADRHGQLDVPHALAADAGQRHFHPATVADDPAMLDALELAARAFPVLDRAENAFAKQAALFRLERAVIDGLGVLDFPFGPGPDGIGRRDTNRDVLHLVDLFQTEQLSGAFFSANHTIRKMEWLNRTGRASQVGPSGLRPYCGAIGGEISRDGGRNQ